MKRFEVTPSGLRMTPQVITNCPQSNNQQASNLISIVTKPITLFITILSCQLAVTAYAKDHTGGEVFSHMVVAVETCSARSAYRLTGSEEIKTCAKLYEDLKMRFLDLDAQSELRLLQKKKGKRSEDIKRLRAISIKGYIKWTQWIKENKVQYDKLVKAAHELAKEEYLDSGRALTEHKKN